MESPISRSVQIPRCSVPGGEPPTWPLPSAHSRHVAFNPNSQNVYVGEDLVSVLRNRRAFPKILPEPEEAQESTLPVMGSGRIRRVEPDCSRGFCRKRKAHFDLDSFERPEKTALIKNSPFSVQSDSFVQARSFSYEGWKSGKNPSTSGYLFSSQKPALFRSGSSTSSLVVNLLFFL